jgi:hypothetical protein
MKFVRGAGLALLLSSASLPAGCYEGGFVGDECRAGSRIAQASVSTYRQIVATAAPVGWRARAAAPASVGSIVRASDPALRVQAGWAAAQPARAKLGLKLPGAVTNASSPSTPPLTAVSVARRASRRRACVTARETTVAACPSAKRRSSSAAPPAQTPTPIRRTAARASSGVPVDFVRLAFAREAFPVTWC